MISNASFDGRIPVQPVIRDMKAGDHGYTVPWAFTPSTGVLDERCDIYPQPHGTVELRVDCIMSGVYKVKLIAKSNYKFTLKIQA